MTNELIERLAREARLQDNQPRGPFRANLSELDDDAWIAHDAAALARFAALVAEECAKHVEALQRDDDPHDAAQAIRQAIRTTFPMPKDGT